MKIEGKYDLKKIGRFLMSTWGAYLVSYIENKDGSVRFFGNENDDRFYVDVKKEDLEKYNY